MQKGISCPKNAKLGLALGALGVVYGDIGTSPLYTIQECFHGTHAIDPSIPVLYCHACGVCTLRSCLECLGTEEGRATLREGGCSRFISQN